MGEGLEALLAVVGPHAAVPCGGAGSGGPETPRPSCAPSPSRLGALIPGVSARVSRGQEERLGSFTPASPPDVSVASGPQGLSGPGPW